MLYVFLYVSSGVFIVFIFFLFFPQFNTEKTQLNPQAQPCQVSDPQLSSLLVLSLGDFWNWKAWFLFFLYFLKSTRTNLPCSYWFVVAIKSCHEESRNILFTGKAWLFTPGIPFYKVVGDLLGHVQRMSVRFLFWPYIFCPILIWRGKRGMLLKTVWYGSTF